MNRCFFFFFLFMDENKLKETPNEMDELDQISPVDPDVAWPSDMSLNTKQSSKYIPNHVTTTSSLIKVSVPMHNV